MTDLIQQILNTISEEIKRAAFQKCQELSLDINKGSIPLEEAFSNLFDIRDSLSDAIAKGKLSQLPITVQKTVLSNLESISRSLAGLVNGTDEIINFVDGIETLYYNLYIFRFDNMSEEYLGFKSKENNLKYLLTQAERLKQSLEEGLKSKESLGTLTISIETQKAAIDQVVNSSNELLNDIKATNQESTTTNQNVSAIYANVQQIESNIKTHQANVTTSNAEVTATEKRIKDFFVEIEQYKSKIDTVSSDAKQAVENNKTETTGLIIKLEELELKIKDQIEKATGFSLFQSFQKRQEVITQSKSFWSVMLFGLVAASILWSIGVVTLNHNFDLAFYLKLGVTIPLIYGITFCNLQYSRERRLEEEYAFKSNISLSLVAYKELIEKMTDPAKIDEKEKFTSFLIETIRNVYTSPTEKIFDHDGKKQADSQDLSKQLKKVIEAVVSPLEPLFKIMHH